MERRKVTGGSPRGIPHALGREQGSGSDALPGIRDIPQDGIQMEEEEDVWRVAARQEPPTQKLAQGDVCGRGVRDTVAANRPSDAWRQEDIAHDEAQGACVRSLRVHRDGHPPSARPSQRARRGRGHASAEVLEGGAQRDVAGRLQGALQACVRGAVPSPERGRRLQPLRNHVGSPAERDVRGREASVRPCVPRIRAAGDHPVRQRRSRRGRWSWACS